MADDDASTAPEEIYTLDHCLERFVSEVDQLTRDQQSASRRLESTVRTHIYTLHRSLQTQVRRDVEMLRAELRTECRFRLFRSLPSEVRKEIWEFALPSRVVEFRTNYVARAMPPQAVPPGSRPMGAPGPVLNTSRLPPPVLAYVCHEARQVALKHGKLVRTKVVDDLVAQPAWGSRAGPPPPSPGMLPLPGMTASSMGPSIYTTGWTWFSPKRDWIKLTVQVGSGGPPRHQFTQHPPGGGGGRGLGGIDSAEHNVWKGLMGEAEKVLVRRPTLLHEFERTAERVGFGAFPNLRTLGVVVGYDVIQPRRSMVLETRLFANDPFVFVNLNNLQEVERVAAIFAADPYETAYAERWRLHAEAIRAGQPWRPRTSPFPGWTETEGESLLTSWVRTKYRHSPVTMPLSDLIDPAADSEFEDEDHPWVQAELAAMPEIQILQVLILDDHDSRDVRRLYGNTWGGKLAMMAMA